MSLEQDISIFRDKNDIFLSPQKHLKGVSLNIQKACSFGTAGTRGIL